MNFTWKYIKNRAINIAQTREKNEMYLSVSETLNLVNAQKQDDGRPKKIHGFITRTEWDEIKTGEKGEEGVTS